MIKNTILIFSILLLSILLVGTAYIVKNGDICCKYEICKQLTSICVDGEDDSEDGLYQFTSSKGDRLYVDIEQDDVLSVDDIVKGKVSGNWFFEGTFPVKVINSEEEIIGELLATSDGDWMTEEYVFFTLELHSYLIELEEEESVVLRFENDNPSGLDENSDFVSISIVLKPKEENRTLSLKVFFPNNKISDMSDCSLVYPVEREIEETVAVGRAALEELFKGLSDDEKDNGYFTNINDGVEIQGLVIEDGIANVDLSSELEEGVGGSCRVSSIRAQIEETLKQFPTVDSVVISIDGESEDILQP